MVIRSTRVHVKGISAQSIYDFMLNCTDEQYNKWWPGTHLAFHTMQRTPDDVGNLVYFDEMVGKRRLRYKAVVTKATPNAEIVWQMKKGVLLPGWLSLRLRDVAGGVEIVHTLSAGYRGLGKILDPLLRLYLNEDFSRDLTDHANTEFQKLATLLGPTKR